MPEEGKHAIAGIDDADMTTFADAADNIARNTLGAEHHRIAERAAEQGGIHKAWTDIGKVNII